MDVDLIRTFVQVAKARHFRKAAEQLFLTQSAVSARIKLLEERLGAKLFERSKHQVSLTTAGVRFMAHAEELLAAWAHACQEVRLPERATASLVAGATDTLWNIFLTDWMITASKAFPEMMIRSELHTPESLMPALLDGSLDIAVMFDAPALPRLYVEELGSISLIMVADRKGLNAEQALQFRFVDVNWGESFAVAMQQHYSHSVPSLLHTSVGKVALELILKSGGAAYLPQQMVSRHISEHKLFPVEGTPAIVRPVYAAMLAGKESDPLLQGTVAQMRSCLDETAGSSPRLP
ncbi:transcriptional regulator, LysR family [Mariprofundus ferrinatatus]|uniref:Transcriptional regulator, LysR family n=1 Tax=Mariprofundus ferrinatatus TaxID=1921087 RepID=A0A2K8L7I1_9PROT|nr:LysR family transcriptional regulator [Mariprofundus ferrinatatus]ATX83092.1 transcriptional regulator, LysR family [Mariprofundus ferrinatatus]